jgi:hypothetical protein
MELSNSKRKLAAIATGTALLVTGIGLFIYWEISRRSWCVRTVSISSQEVTYSWGCVHPQRFRQWSITASAESAEKVSNALERHRFQAVDGDV